MDNLELILTEELQQEFLDYLKEDPDFDGIESLNEEVLTEGKLLNKIRWKLALFSLRFLKESSIDDFLKAYYSDKDGKETEKSKEWVAKKKKEKLIRMRELANEMKQEEKDKVANSQQAKQLEKSALMSGIVAAGAGVSAGASAYSKSNINLARTETEKTIRSNDAPYGYGTGTYEVHDKNSDFISNLNPDGDVTYVANNKDNLKTFADAGEFTTKNGSFKFSPDVSSELKRWNRIDNNLSKISIILSTLSSIIFGVMWGSLIVAGVSAVRGLRQAHKANVVRRDEIMGELLKNRDAKNLKECLQFLDGDLESQKSIIELYESGSPVFYNAVENIKQQASLSESLKFMIK